jgi:hypothetical protein
VCWLLSPQGEYLGDVAVPEDSFKISNGMMAAIAWTISEGLPQLAVYEIKPRVPGLDYP